MANKHFFRCIAFTVTVILMFGTLINPTVSADMPPDGTAYVVQPGDTLSAIAQAHLGDSSAWVQIVAATNSKAALSPDFATIEDPARLAVGQRLWIPETAAVALAGLAEPVTPVVGRLLGPVVPLPLADGQVHLVYDIALTNWARQDVTLTQVTVVDPEHADKVLAQWESESIASILVHRSAKDVPAELVQGETAVILLDVIVPTDDVPAVVEHQLSFSPPIEVSNTSLSQQWFLPVKVAGAPVEIGLPFAGDGWVALEFLTESFAGSVVPSHHRQAVIPMDGQLMLSERFAYDWMRVDEEGNLYHGDPNRAEDYVGYGADLLAVADGTVIAAVDKYPNTPLPFAEAMGGQTVDSLAGNRVVLDIGNGNYVLYAHLKPGSVTVAEGDRVTRGQVMGQLGQSGNSTAPHLHFHVMDRPSPTGLCAQGLPYVFDSMSASDIGDLSVINSNTIVYHLPVPFAYAPYQGCLPLNLSVVQASGQE
jgi:murein DD-endopeptidase MepM/ murein hydrolase activator NlpD